MPVASLKLKLKEGAGLLASVSPQPEVPKVDSRQGTLDNRVQYRALSGQDTLDNMAQCVGLLDPKWTADRAPWTTWPSMYSYRAPSGQGTLDNMAQYVQGPKWTGHPGQHDPVCTATGPQVDRAPWTTWPSMYRAPSGQGTLDNMTQYVQLQGPKWTGHPGQHDPVCTGPSVDRAPWTTWPSMYRALSGQGTLDNMAQYVQLQGPKWTGHPGQHDPVCTGPSVGRAPWTTWPSMYRALSGQGTLDNMTQYVQLQGPKWTGHPGQHGPVCTGPSVDRAPWTTWPSMYSYRAPSGQGTLDNMAQYVQGPQWTGHPGQHDPVCTATGPSVDRAPWTTWPSMYRALSGQGTLDNMTQYVQGPQWTGHPGQHGPVCTGFRNQTQ